MSPTNREGNRRSLGSAVREAKTERHRAALVAAARQVFDRDLVSDAKVSDISRIAQVAYGTFYSYFASKEEIFREVITEITERAFRAADRDDAPPPTGTPTDRIAAANARYFEVVQLHAVAFVSLEHLAVSKPEFAELYQAVRERYFARSARAIRAWQVEGLVPADLDVEYVTRALGYTVERYAYMAFVFGDGREDASRALSAVNHVWINSLGLG